MFIVDFDDTLFDTHSYKQVLFDSVRPLGVTEEIFWKSYQQAKQNEWGKAAYSDRRHAQMLALYNFEEGKVFEALQDVNKRVKEFLFPDAVSFLEGINKLDDTVVLLSLGDPETQEMKVKGCGIDHFFDRMFMVNEKKSQIIHEVVGNHEKTSIWFINDKVRETKEVVEQYPSLRVVLRKSPSIDIQEYEESGFPFFSSLNEILEYVKQQ